MERLNILFLTYCYPPQKFPRSVQISHLVQYLRKDFNITVVTSEPENEGDPSLLSFTPLDNVVYAPKSNFTKIIERSKGHRIKKEILPDFQYLWHFDLFRKARVLIDDSSPDVIITFGHPMSTHIAGLKLKRKFPHIKWLAHFSDPWVDNIFNDYNAWTKWINKYYQDSVLKSADRLIFTSQETIDLVTKYYSEEVRKKSICLPHIFNQALYFHQSDHTNEKIILRYIGNFYGNRQPDSFLKALKLLSHEQRAQLRVEFIGSEAKSIKDIINFFKLEDTVFTYPAVSYIKSLELMHSADILLIIDAPTEKSPFLPSKLIDYIGANKPIFGITPPGTSQKLIEEMGFLVADSRDVSDISNKLMQMIESFSKNKSKKVPLNIRDRYSISNVGEKMKDVLETI
ncbi:glycosyl transferases group 1 [Holospora elegans E1]|uniref:Glycosyl transferases group 1 n=1 Tax=Holospora elegans E1 TaxID=1427503 RepID=A0A023DZM6_9PROT|nr:glycosyltransferase [Holospora elegans]GAJ46485.1 glycosyl transferases group 1 [Holospora elegans E1]